MRNLKYEIKPSICKHWFKPPTVKWAVWVSYEYWDNNIFSGLSGWTSYTGIIYKYDSKEEAVSFLKSMEVEYEV